MGPFKKIYNCRPRWPRRLSCGSVAARLLRLWIWISAGGWMFLSCGRCVLSRKGICDCRSPVQCHTECGVSVCDVSVCGVYVWCVCVWCVCVCDVSVCGVSVCGVSVCDVLCVVCLCVVCLRVMCLCGVCLCVMCLCVVFLCVVCLCVMCLCDVSVCGVSVCDVSVCDVLCVISKLQHWGDLGPSRTVASQKKKTLLITEINST